MTPQLGPRRNRLSHSSPPTVLQLHRPSPIAIAPGDANGGGAAHQSLGGRHKYRALARMAARPEAGSPRLADNNTGSWLSPRAPSLPRDRFPFFTFPIATYHQEAKRIPRIISRACVSVLYYPRRPTNPTSDALGWCRNLRRRASSESAASPTTTSRVPGRNNLHPTYNTRRQPDLRKPRATTAEPPP